MWVWVSLCSCMSVCECVWGEVVVPHCIYGCQRTTWRSWFSPSTIYVSPKIELKELSDLDTSVFTHLPTLPAFVHFPKHDACFAANKAICRETPAPCGEDNARAEGPRDRAEATDLVSLSTMVGARSKLGRISNKRRKNHCLVCVCEPQAGCAVCILRYILWHRSSWPLTSSCQTLQ